MAKLSRNGLKVLKAVHLLAIAGWFGGGLTANLLVYKTGALNPESSLSTTLEIISTIDTLLVPLCALLTVLTGIVYGAFTHWGFFRQAWIVIKWLITILVVASGAVFTGKYLGIMGGLAVQLGHAALQNPEFIAVAKTNQILGLVQLVCLFIAMVLSIWKPGAKRLD